MGILAFVIILSVLIIIHECGHFFMARRSGVAVEEFAIGFPPKITAIRRGATRYVINAIPFGGYVRLVGENGDDERRTDSFLAAKHYRQVLILVAGVIMNFLLAIVIMTIVLVSGVRTDPNTVSHDQFAIVGAPHTEIALSQNGPAAKAGLRTTDTFVDINGQKVADTDGIVSLVTAAGYKPIVIHVIRDHTPLAITVTPVAAGDVPKYGLGLATTVLLRYPWYVAPWYGFRASTDIAWQTVVGFGSLIKGLGQGHVSQDVTGPIGIAVLTSEVSRFGIISLLQFTAVLSVSLAILNILPLPALDGGRIFLRLYSWISRRPVNRQLEGAIHTVGFYLLIAFLLYISARDVQRFNVVSRLIHWFQ